MARPWPFLLLLAALCTTPILAFWRHHYQAGAANDSTADNELLPRIARVVRQITFQGQSSRPRPPFPSQTRDQCDCQHHVTCAAQLDKIRQTCELPGVGTGVCCPSVAGGNVGLRTSSQTRSNSVFDVEKLSEVERILLRKGIILKRGTPASYHLRVFKIRPQTQELHKKAKQLAAASSHMASDLRLSCSQLNQYDAGNSILGVNCLPNPKCRYPRSKYRTANGECNNLNNPIWGKSETGLQRLLPPKYEESGNNCMDAPRETSVQGGKLPLARTLASDILTDVNLPDQSLTLSVMQWAQFMDHDLALSPFPMIEVKGREEGMQCCTEDGKQLPQRDLHPWCFPIEIPRNDGFFKRFSQTCMNFIRSRIVPPYAAKCRFGHVEQINTNTHWIDGSTVYGQDEEKQIEVRTLHGGLLRTSGNNFLPEDSEAPQAECDSRRGVCFLAGESRVNEQPGLTLMHTVWLRQHNRVARQLQQLNPSSNDETLFQETRRIIAAQIAHITYNEWLPIIIGGTFMEEYGLSPQRNGFSSDYDPNVNANINNEFSTAAFRFGHSLVQGIINLFSVQGSVSSNRLRDNFMSGQLITQPGFFDRFLRGLTRQSSQKMDNHVTQDLTNHLFQTPGHDFGMDLMSLNIQRGRDHAIGTYNEARDLCKLGKARTFNDLTNTIPTRIVQQLSQLYANVDDIDMFVGGMAETPVFGALLGPTFLCIVGDQFARLKIGDRYYYELQGQAGQFSLAQLQEIRRTSWARIVCDNSDNLDEVQPLAFRTSSNNNPRVSCNSPLIPQMNLQLWGGLQQRG